MARYTGPTTKIARKLGTPIFKEDKAYEKRPYPPGQHGNSRRRTKKSEYAVQLMEKQKAKFTYGILEKQFRNLFETASQSKGVTGEELLKLCEVRLDNIVYRLGLSPTRQGARQLVSHRHVLVNGNVVNIPSYSLMRGDKVSIRERSKNLEVIKNSLVDATFTSDEWLVWNPDALEGTLVEFPTRKQIPEDIKEQLIVELYSK